MNEKKVKPFAIGADHILPSMPFLSHNCGRKHEPFIQAQSSFRTQNTASTEPLFCGFFASFPRHDAGMTWRLKLMERVNSRITPSSTQVFLNTQQLVVFCG